MDQLEPLNAYQESRRIRELVSEVSLSEEIGLDNIGAGAEDVERVVVSIAELEVEPLSGSFRLHVELSNPDADPLVTETFVALRFDVTRLVEDALRRHRELFARQPIEAAV